jgi:UDP-glucose 4-epimerase
MRALVTGGAGFVGSHIVDSLIEQNYEVIIWDNLCTGKRENVNSKAHFESQDIHLPHRPIKCDVIFHLAALARIQPSFKDPLTTHHSNMTGTIAMLDLARKNGAKFVYPGSSSFYHDPYANPYTFTKWGGEEYCKLYNKVYNVPIAIARFFNVYGPRQLEDGVYATVIGIFEKQLREGQKLTITWDGKQRRDFTHVADIVSAMIAMSYKDWGDEIFNLGTGRNYSINELAAMMLEMEVIEDADELEAKLIESGKVEYLPRRPGEATTTLADISLANDKLGWSPQHNLPNYINSVI